MLKFVQKFIILQLLFKRWTNRWKAIYFNWIWMWKCTFKFYSTKNLTKI